MTNMPFNNDLYTGMVDGTDNPHGRGTLTSSDGTSKTDIFIHGVSVKKEMIAKTDNDQSELMTNMLDCIIGTCDNIEDLLSVSKKKT